MKSSKLAINSLLVVSLTTTTLIIILACLPAPIIAAEPSQPTTPSIDESIVQVETSLDQVQSLLNEASISDDPAQKAQFAELGKHVNIIRDQLRLIQEEYHFNKDIDNYQEQLTEWSGRAAREIGERFQAMHHHR